MAEKNSEKIIRLLNEKYGESLERNKDLKVFINWEGKGRTDIQVHWYIEHEKYLNWTEVKDSFRISYKENKEDEIRKIELFKRDTIDSNEVTVLDADM